MVAPYPLYFINRPLPRQAVMRSGISLDLEIKGKFSLVYDLAPAQLANNALAHDNYSCYGSRSLDS